MERVRLTDMKKVMCDCIRELGTWARKGERRASYSPRAGALEGITTISGPHGTVGQLSIPQGPKESGNLGTSV